MARRTLVVMVLALAAPVLGACGSDGDGASDQGGAAESGSAGVVEISGPSLAPGDPVAVPAEPILLIDGLISAPNLDDALALDVATIEQLAVVELTVDEPFEGRPMTFRGAWVADLLALAGVDEAATSVRMHALDDYEVTFTLEDLREGEALLAVRADGALLSIDQAGPTRIIFSDESDVGSNRDVWIWSLDRITVE